MRSALAALLLTACNGTDNSNVVASNEVSQTTPTGGGASGVVEQRGGASSGGTPMMVTRGGASGVVEQRGGASSGGTPMMVTRSGASGVGGANSARGGTNTSIAAGGTNAAGTWSNSAVTNAGASSLGAYPFANSPKTRGGTMTFANIGAPGWWPRRINRKAGDPACTYKDGTDTWGGHCCMKEQPSTSTMLAPFDEEMTLILKAIDVRQLAIYQPSTTGSVSGWSRVTAWDARSRKSENLWFTQQGNGSTTFPGDLTQTDCVSYVMQEPKFDCGDGANYYCPNDAGVLHRGYSGSKLVVLLASMTFPDANVKPCNGSGTAKPAPWVAFVASELVRDGGRKWNGLCNCYSKTGSVGDGCGEINVFEVVMDDNTYSNREFASTGVRSYQAGHIGGAVAGSTLSPSNFAADSDVVDVCAKAAYAVGPVLVADGKTDGCPVWRRPSGDRYFFILLDETTRSIQVGIIHPDNVPAAASELLPSLPVSLPRATVDAMIQMRLPG